MRRLNLASSVTGVVAPLVAPVVALLLAAFWATAASAATSLIGSSVTGSLEFGTNTTNFFDPAAGLVPNGPLNKLFGTTVTIGSPDVEFGYGLAGSADHINADFDGTTLTLTDVSSLSGTRNPFHFSFTDAAFLGLSVSKTSDTWINGGLSDSLSGDTLTIDWGGGLLNNGVSQSAVFTFSGFTSGNGSGRGASVPLPAAVWPGLITAAALACFAMRRALV